MMTSEVIDLTDLDTYGATPDTTIAVEAKPEVKLETSSRGMLPMPAKRVKREAKYRTEGELDNLALNIWQQCQDHVMSLPTFHGIVPHYMDAKDLEAPASKFYFNDFVTKLTLEVIRGLLYTEPSVPIDASSSFTNTICTLYKIDKSRQQGRERQTACDALARALSEAYDRSCSDSSRRYIDPEYQDIFKVIQRFRERIKTVTLSWLRTFMEMSDQEKIRFARSLPAAVLTPSSRLLTLNGCDTSPAMNRRMLIGRAPTLVPDERKLPLSEMIDRHSSSYGSPAWGSLPAQALSSTQHAPPQKPLLNNAEEFETFLNELREEELDQDEGTNTIQEVLEAAKLIGATQLPDGKFALPGLLCSLHPHQVIGVAWMYKRERPKEDDGKRSKVRGGLLADAMGLGKTVQAIGVMLKNRPGRYRGYQPLSRVHPRNVQATKPTVTLIICPVALVHQWEREISNKAPGAFRNIRVHHGSTKLRTLKEFQETDIIITSYGTVAREYPIRKHRHRLTDDEKSKDELRIDREKGLLFRVHFFRIILDEAHTIKNPAANVSVACCNLEAVRQWCLTGTPFQNRVDDIFPIMAILQVPYFSVRQNFREAIRNTEEGATKLRAALAPFLKRRNKDDKIAGQKVLTLPEKKVVMKHLSLDKDELDLYKQVESQMVTQINKFLKAGIAVKKINHIFIMVLRLRQLCIHPYLILEHLASKSEYDQQHFARSAGSMRAYMDLFAAGFQDDEDATICEICQSEAVDPVVSASCKDIFCSSCIFEQCEDEESMCPACNNAIGTLTKYKPGSRSRVAVEEPFTPQSSAPTAPQRLIEAEPAIRPDPRLSRRSKEAEANTDLKPKLEPALSTEVVGARASLLDANLHVDGTLAMKVEPELFQTRNDFKPTKSIVGSTSSRSRPDAILLDSEDEELPDLVISPLKSEEKQGHLSPISTPSRVTRRLASRTPTHAISADRAFTTSANRSQVETGLATVTRPPTIKRRYSVDPADQVDEGLSMSKYERQQSERNWQELLKLDLIPSTKLTAAEEQLRAWMKADGSKIIVFSQFVRALDLLAKICDLNDWPILRYQGSMNMREREDVISRFEHPQGPRILLMSLKAGGVGLNLVCASKVLLLDFWWNASAEHQAIDRCHRMGQVLEVTVIRTYIPGTVEEKILELQESKLKTAGTVLGEQEGGGKMARVGLRELMSLFGRVTTDRYGVQQIVGHQSGQGL